MKRLFIAVGAIAATTFAIKKVIEYSTKEKEVEDESDDNYFINLSGLEDYLDDLEDEMCDEEYDFESIVDETSELIKDVGSKLNEFLSNIPKVSVTINIDKKEK